MDFSLTEEQTLLQESVDRFIQNDYEFDKRQSFANSELGFSEDNWKMFADLGWLGFPSARQTVVLVVGPLTQ